MAAEQHSQGHHMIEEDSYSGKKKILIKICIYDVKG